MIQMQVVRLAINLASDVADLLHTRARRKDLSITEAVRRAITIWDFIEAEKTKGNRIGIIEGRGRNERLREIDVLD